MRRRSSRHTPRPRIPFSVALLVIVGVFAGIVTRRLDLFDEIRAGATPSSRPSAPSTMSPRVVPSPQPSPKATIGPINTSFDGITTFRGNATRSWYGDGPVPRNPQVLWRYPSTGSLCSFSSDQNGERKWCGTGWTGQPNVIVAHDGSIEVRINAYDGAYHFLDGLTGTPVRSSLQTGDLAKGSATSDPDGYPLYYAGSRDNYLRVIALDRAEPTVLWSIDSTTTVANPLWNTDWDGAPLVIDGHLLEGGENSWFYVIRLNRDYNASGKVTVDPEIVLTVPGYDQELLAALPDMNVSIESSVAFHDGVAYFANSGGLVQGWDISRILEGGRRAHRVFRFWTGEDTDATVVVDEKGFVYVASELERFSSRAMEVGQLMKLDPSRSDDPLVWSFAIPELGRTDGVGGAWATPALHGDMVYIATNVGDLIGIDRDTGVERWRIPLVGPTWSSPVVVDDVLIQGDCAGDLHAFDVSRPNREPPLIWTIRLDGCIESTPSVLEGMIWIGTRGGGVFAIGDRRN